MKNNHVTHSHVHPYFLTAIVLFVVPISGLSIDIYVPSLPAISDYFGVDKAFAQLSITAYMIGFGMMQLCSGIISDCYGRKLPFLIAITIFAIAAFATPFAQNINQLIILRFIQGLSVGCLIVPMRAVIFDLFQGKEFYKMVTYLSIAWAIGPIIAPAIGGYLQQQFDWKASFYFLGIYGSISLLLNLLFMPETIQEKKIFDVSSIRKTHIDILTHKVYLLTLTSLGLLYSLPVLFSVVGPFYLQNTLHYTPLQFGQFSLLMGVCLFLGNITNRILINTSMLARVNTCYIIMIFVLITAISLLIFLPNNIFIFLSSNAIVSYAGGIIFPNHFGKSMGLFPKAAATANALMGASMIFIASLGSLLGAALKATTAFPLMLSYLAITILCFGAYQFSIKLEKNAPLTT